MYICKYVYKWAHIYFLDFSGGSQNKVTLAATPSVQDFLVSNNIPHHNTSGLIKVADWRVGHSR